MNNPATIAAIVVPRRKLKSYDLETIGQPPGRTFLLECINQLTRPLRT